MNAAVKKLLRLYELGNGADDAAYESFVDTFVSSQYAYSDGTPSAAPVLGTWPMKANRRTLRAAMPDLRVTVLDDDVLVDVAKRRVALRWSATGTFAHDLGPVKATRRPVLYSGTYFASFDESHRLVAGVGAWDLFAFLAQLGVLDQNLNPFRLQPQQPTVEVVAPIATVVVPTTTTTTAVAPKQTPPSTPTRRGSANAASAAANNNNATLSPEFDSMITNLSSTRNAWSIVDTEFGVLHSGTAADDQDALSVGAALLRDDQVAVLLVNCSDARHAKRVVRVTWCGNDASRAERTALSHCRLRLDATIKLFTTNFNAFSTEDFEDIRRKVDAF
jgi:hypothetical protein